MGLSPRGRGNHSRHHQRPRCCGSIPAWAGEPTEFARWTSPRAVYPRVGGGTILAGVTDGADSGLSPRGRGNHGAGLCAGLRPGSIPAWAGEPIANAINVLVATVYPRVGGGTYGRIVHRRPQPGLSPRGRGNLTPVLGSVIFLGSIPAWAGEPGCPTLGARSSGVYPRVGGGTGTRDRLSRCFRGLSPRGRGNHDETEGPRSLNRSIPAWAGEPQATR